MFMADIKLIQEFFPIFGASLLTQLNIGGKRLKVTRNRVQVKDVDIQLLILDIR